MTMPFTPATRVEATCPPPPSRVIDFVMVSPPNPPGSSASISPPGAVFEMAPAQVLHGAVRLHGLASSPTPETQVRVACADAGVPCKQSASAVAANARVMENFCIILPPSFRNAYNYSLIY